MHLVMNIRASQAVDTHVYLKCPRSYLWLTSTVYLLRTLFYCYFNRCLSPLFIHFKNRSTLLQAIVYSIAVNWFAKIIDRYLWHMASGFSPPHSSQQWCAQKRTHLQPFCSKFDIVWAGRGVFSYQSQYKSPKTFGLY